MNEMINEFKRDILLLTSAVIVDKYIFSENEPAYVSLRLIDILKNKIKAKFALNNEDKLDLFVVGSSKLGFSYIEKRTREGYKPAYRSYDPRNSDVDIAVVSPKLYGKLWLDLGAEKSIDNYFPHKGILSNYMFHGWIRPDKFDEYGSLKCKDWVDVINEAQTTEFRHLKLRCGIYHSKTFLKMYQQRGIKMAQDLERLKV